jgi:predicted metalloprotease with PDZ domain
LLWAFEGFTSYYDDLLLLRAGLLSELSYLETLGRTITQVLRGAGRRKQPVAESSFDAWIKYYRQDENSPNAVVSYYQKGSLVALCLDLLLRSRTHGRVSLDHVMRALWRKYGRRAIGVPEDGVEKTAEEVSGLRLKSFFDRALRQTGELPLASLLRSAGVELTLRRAESLSDRGGKHAAKPNALPRVDLGIRSRAEGAEVRITHVLDDGAAQRAGISAGDTLLAIDGLRVTAKNLEERLATLRPGQRSEWQVFRRDELMRFSMLLTAAPRDTCVLTPLSDPGAARKRRAWLQGTRARLRPR